MNSSGQPKVLAICGPNGSGKSTVYQSLLNDGQVEALPWVNADDFLRTWQAGDSILLSDFGLLAADRVEFNLSVERHALTTVLRENGGQISLYASPDGNVRIDKYGNSYEAAIATAVLRSMLIARGLSFSFETVMSHPSKIDILQEATAAGFKTQLVFVCTEDANINVLRVAQRVAEGGHHVPEDKIRSRYKRAIDLHPSAAAACTEVTLLDTSNGLRVIATRKLGSWKSYLPLPAWAKPAILNPPS